MCTYLQSDYALPNCKCILWCCDYCTCINLPDLKTYHQYSETTPSIRFQIYHIIGRYTAHGRISLKDKKYVTCVNKNICRWIYKYIHQRRYSYDETKISGFLTSVYIPAIQKLVFHLPHMRILGTNICGAMQHTAFKWRDLFQDILCRCDYDERVVPCFAHQIKS